MRLLQTLETGWLGVKVSAEHAENAAGALVAHVVNRAVRDVVLFEVCPHIRIRPEGHRLRCGPLGVKGVAAGFEPILLAQLTFAGHGADDWDAPGFMGVLFQRLFLHFVAAFRADPKGRVE